LVSPFKRGFTPLGHPKTVRRLVLVQAPSHLMGVLSYQVGYSLLWPQNNKGSLTGTPATKDYLRGIEERRSPSFR
jgi:hypothetical protein